MRVWHIWHICCGSFWVRCDRGFSSRLPHGPVPIHLTGLGAGFLGGQRWCHGAKSSFQSLSRHQEPGIPKIPKIQDLHGGVPLSLVHLSSPRTSSISHKTQEFHRLQTSLAFAGAPLGIRTSWRCSPHLWSF